MVDEHGYQGSYRSLLRFVHRLYPGCKVRPFRRVEFPPAAQAQVDWLESAVVLAGEGRTRVYGFVMTLSHSRMTAVLWKRSMDQLSWQDAHNQAFQRLGGVPAVVRIDNLKTGVARGAGPKAVRNQCYEHYARTVGFPMDVCLPGQAHHKGKVERRMEDVRSILSLWHRVFDGLEDLQAYTDQRMAEVAHRRRCPATGQTIYQTWQQERGLLRPPVHLPEVFDVVVLRDVGRDCLVGFEGRRYAVPFAYCGRQVEVRGTADQVQIYCEGRKLIQYPRGTEARILIDPSCYDGKETDRVDKPLPLGRLSQRVLELASASVELRAVDDHAALVEELES